MPIVTILILIGEYYQQVEEAILAEKEIQT